MAMEPAPNGWILRESTAGGARHSGANLNALPEGLLRVQTVVVDRTYQATLASPETRPGTPPELIIRQPVGSQEAYLLAIRHPSGALTFHTIAQRLRTLPSANAVAGPSP